MISTHNKYELRYSRTGGGGLFSGYGPGVHIVDIATDITLCSRNAMQWRPNVVTGLGFDSTQFLIPDSVELA